MNDARTGGCEHLLGLMQMDSDKVSKTTVLAFSVEEPHHDSWFWIGSILVLNVLSVISFRIFLDLGYDILRKRNYLFCIQLIKTMCASDRKHIGLQCNA
jgi:hypothetical protein